MRLYLCLLFITFSITACRAEPSDDKLVQSGIDIQTETIADGLNYPWAVAFLSGGGYLVTERPGDLIHIDESGHKTTIQNTPGVYDRGQGGLLDVIIGQGDMIYLFSDGFPDQFGGGDNKKLKMSGFHQIMESIVQFPMDQQYKMYSEALNQWMGDNTQMDDILLMAFEYD